MAQPGGGFFATKPGVLGAQGAPDWISTSWSTAATEARARTAPCRRPWTWPAWPTPARRRQRRRCAWTSSPSGPSCRPPGCRRCPAGSWPRGSEAPGWDGWADRHLYRQAPFRWFVHRHRGDRGLGRRRPLRRAGRSSHRPGGGGRALPGRRLRRQRVGACLPGDGAVAVRPAPAAHRRRPDPVLLGQVPGRGGDGERPRRAARPSSPPGWRRSCGTRPPTVAALAGRARGLAHRFPGRGRRAVVGQRGQHHPRIAGEVPLVG